MQPLYTYPDNYPNSDMHCSRKPGHSKEQRGSAGVSLRYLIKICYSTNAELCNCDIAASRSLMSAVHVVTSPDNFKSLLSKDLTRVSLINFWAPWADPCVKMNTVVKELSKKYPQVLMLEVCCSQDWKCLPATHYWYLR